MLRPLAAVTRQNIGLKRDFCPRSPEDEINLPTGAYANFHQSEALRRVNDEVGSTAGEWPYNINENEIITACISTPSIISFDSINVFSITNYQ